MKEIFVFGSNLLGLHAGGAARHAYDNCYASWGVGEGLQGLSYAIPTKADFSLSLPLKKITEHVNRFIVFAREQKVLTFKVTRIGCGLAGFTDEQIAPLFQNAPSNCIFSSKWKDLLPDREYFDEPA